MDYFLLVTKYDFVQYLFGYFCHTLAKENKFKVILKAKSAVSRLVRMCLTQPGSGLLLPVYYRPKSMLY